LHPLRETTRVDELRSSKKIGDLGIDTEVFI